MKINIALYIPAIILIIFYLYLCFSSIFKSTKTRFLPKWAWCIICLISIPLGGIIYFFVGKEHE